MTDTDTRIWRATAPDLPGLVALFDAYRQWYGQPAAPEAAHAFLSARLTAGESVIFLAGDRDHPLGFTQLYPVFSSTRMARIWLLNDLFVSAQARDRGIGNALLERARRHARETGACELMLETANDNPARRLYERSGYSQVTNFVFYRREP